MFLHSSRLSAILLGVALKDRLNGVLPEFTRGGHVTVLETGL